MRLATKFIMVSPKDLIVGTVCFRNAIALAELAAWARGSFFLTCCHYKRLLLLVIIHHKISVKWEQL